MGRQRRGGHEGSSLLDQPAQSALKNKTLNPDWCTLFIYSRPVTCSLACARSTQGAKSRPDPATSPPGPARPPRVVYGHLSQEQTRFNNALAGFLGVPVKLPLLAPLAMTLDLKRMFVEVGARRGGCVAEGTERAKEPSAAHAEDEFSPLPSSLPLIATQVSKLGGFEAASTAGKWPALATSLQHNSTFGGVLRQVCGHSGPRSPLLNCPALLKLRRPNDMQAH